MFRNQFQDNIEAYVIVIFYCVTWFKMEKEQHDKTSTTDETG